MTGDRHLYNLVQASFIVIKVVQPDLLTWFDVFKPLFVYMGLMILSAIFFGSDDDSDNEDNGDNGEYGQNSEAANC